MLAQRTANDEASVVAYEGAIQPLVDIAMHSDSTDDVCAAERPSFRLKPSEPQTGYGERTRQGRSRP